ncbi:MAG: hypothetical protein KJO98_05965 [Rhodothermia bacterium]|nr:hypothetical protein [Rhodothermia bacterium]
MTEESEYSDAYGGRENISRRPRRRRPGIAFAIGLIALLVSACSGDSDELADMNPQATSSARFTYNCDLQGVNGVLTLEIEAVGSSGIVFGPGSTPVITGVIGTVDFIYFTAGELVSPTARYSFTGENDFADFTNTTVPETFRVQFVLAPQGLTLIVNPFGPGPTQVSCVQTGGQLLA